MLTVLCGVGVQALDKILSFCVLDMYNTMTFAVPAYDVTAHTAI